MTETKRGELVSLDQALEQKQIIETRNAYDLEPADFRAGINRRFSNRKTFITKINKQLVAGKDFGEIVVQGRKCPTLFKPGAEKIAGLLGVRSRWPTIDEQIDRVQAGAKCVILKCQLLDLEDRIVSEGVGARLLDQDQGDLNKAFKMAKKSSLIDAVLNCGGLSELYSQDLEDMPPETLQDEASATYSRSPSDWGGDTNAGSGTSLATHCPLGKHKGEPWDKVPDSYCSWIVHNILDNKPLNERAQKELNDRSLESQESSDRRKDEAAPEHTAGDGIKLPSQTRQERLDMFAKAIANARTLDEIGIIKEDMPEDLRPVFRAYLAKRSVDLRG